MKDDVKSDGAKNKGVKSNDMSKKEIGVSQHPFDQEELMAFLDGELAAERAASAAAHLKNCLECQKLAAAFQQVSQAMVSWEVEQVGSEIPANIAAALNERKKDPARKLNSQRWEWRKLLRVQQLTWAAGLAAATLLVIAVSMPSLLRSNKGAIESARMGQLRQETESRALKPDQEEAQKKNDNNLFVSDKDFVSKYAGATKKFGTEYGRNAGSATKVVPKNGDGSRARKSPGKAADANGNTGSPGQSTVGASTVYTYLLSPQAAPPPPKPAATPAPGNLHGLVASAAAPVAKVNRDFRSASPVEASKQPTASGGAAAEARKDSRVADETVNVTASASTVEVEADATQVTPPMIVRTANLTVTTKEFEKARPAVEEILKRHHGYVGEMNVDTPTGSARSLTATLRVPAAQLEATLADLKGLGRVEKESQNGEEVTQQYVDLEARLKNSRNTEQRLVQLQRERTGKLSDVLSVENQISRVRGEIEQMEAQRKEMRKQVDYATLNLTVSEDYKAELKVVPTSTGTLIRNAAVDGYRSMVDGLLALLLWLLSAMPSLLLWLAILFFPARFTWRRLRHRFLQRELAT